MNKLTKQLCVCSILAMTMAMPPAALAVNAGTVAGQAGAGLCSAGIMGWIAGLVGSAYPAVLTWTSPVTC